MYDKSYRPERFSNTGHNKCDSRETTVTGTKKYSTHHERTLIYLALQHINHANTRFTKEKRIFENGPKFPIVT